MGIWIAAVITTALVVAFYGFLIYKLAPDRRWLLLAGVIALPLQPLAFYLVRVPLIVGLNAALGPGALLTAISMFYAPLTEEPAKWLVLAVPAVRRRLNADNAIALALTIGVGFGIGELWFIADQVARQPQYAGAPFYIFTGFLTERFVVCFMHGAFIAYAVRQLAEGRSFLLGGVLGMALHFAINFPIFLMTANMFSLGQQFWATVNGIWFWVMLVALATWVNYLARGRMRRALLGTATCPECHKVYDRPLFGLNLTVTRYERCPHCRHFHWVRTIGR